MSNKHVFIHVPIVDAAFFAAVTLLGYGLYGVTGAGAGLLIGVIIMAISAISGP